MTKFVAASRFARPHFRASYQVQLVAASAQFRARLALRTPFVHTERNCACTPRRAPARTDGHQRAVVATCRTGGVSFVQTMTNASSCRIAPSSKQYLARGVGLCCQIALHLPDMAGNALCLFSSLGAALPAKGMQHTRFGGSQGACSV